MPIATLNTTTAATLVPAPPPDPSVDPPPIDSPLQAVSGHDSHGRYRLLIIVSIDIWRNICIECMVFYCLIGLHYFLLMLYTVCDLYHIDYKEGAQ